MHLNGSPGSEVGGGVRQVGHTGLTPPKMRRIYQKKIRQKNRFYADADVS